ncbi:MAG: Arylesterase-domain-containing protein [Benniella sp.]|nr:MAG: Arylesterase-domain-containing protein [Benniella sp.]
MAKKQAAAKKVTTTTTTTTTTHKSSRGGKKTTSSSSWKRTLYRYSAFLFGVTIAVSYGFVKSIVTDLGLLLGTVVPFNTEGCEPLVGLETCEDIHIHHPWGLAFTTCGHAESRKGWYPPIGNNNASAENAFKDKFVLYSLELNKFDVMELTGFPEGEDRVFHGLDIYELSPMELIIFAVNHRRTGSVIEVLQYNLGHMTVQYKETIKHELIHTPNDIVALGPRSFYVSNDHHHHSGIQRAIEENLRFPWSNVIYYSPENTFVAFDSVVSANGMSANTDRSTVYLSACFGGGFHILKPRENHTLVEEDYIKLDFFNDNPSYDAQTDSVFVTGHVQPLKMMHGLSVPEKPVVGPSKIVKISKNPQAKADAPAAAGTPKYLVETVLVDDGNLISTGTVAAIDRKRNVMLVGTAFGEKGFVRCPIPEGF